MHSTDEVHEHDLGLSHDLPTLLTRRRALGGLVGAAGLAFLAACGSDDAPTVTTASTEASTAASPTAAAASTAATAATVQIPEETGGPFPGDGSNGINVLDDSGIIRSDITRSFGA